MLAKVWTCAVVGLEGELVQVEVDIARQGLVQFNVVGMPDTAVRRPASGSGRRSEIAGSSFRHGE
jgi:magnesium chelatase family protein